MSTGFERLDKRMVYLAAGMSGVIAVVVAVTAGIGMGNAGVPFAGVVLAAAGGTLLIVGVGAGAEYVRWRASRFRVTDERLELRFDFVVTRRRSLARERIRTVDVTASPMQRLLGVAKVIIGTGVHGATDTAEIKLDPVSRERARELRAELLRRAEPGADAAEPIAVLDWRWALYAPLSFLTPLLGAAAVGAVLNVADWFNRGSGPIELLLGDVLRSALFVVVGTVVVGAVVAGAIGALALFVEMWWSYRLDRERGGSIHVRRGLLTTRSITVEERRLRGVELVEPLGVRLVRAARVDAVATGMRRPGEGRTDHKTLLPAAPRATAQRVAAAVLRAESAPVGGPLVAHPRAAFVRRLRWALAVALVLVAGLAVAAAVIDNLVDPPVALWPVPVAVAVVALPLAVALAADAYRNLGHGLSGRYLVARSGWLRRGTVALQRDGIIGWTVRQSVFQRRAGVLTLVATTAAGHGAYAMPDVDAAEGIEFARSAVPGMVAPFVER